MEGDDQSGMAMKTSRYNFCVESPRDGGDSEEYILLNTLTKSIVKVDTELKSILEMGELRRLNPQIEAQLANLGIIIPNEMDEKRVFGFQHNRLKYMTDESAFLFFPTFSCNGRCTYCYEGAGEHFSETMSKKTADDSAQFIKKVALENKSSRVMLGLYGGEPLLQTDTCRDVAHNIATWARSQGIQFYCNLTTNGTLLTREVADKLLPYVNSIHFTFDGVRDIHNKKRVYKNGSGTYDDIMRAASIVRDMTEKHIAFRIHIDEDNYDSTQFLLDELEERGFKDRKNLHIYFVQLESPEACLKVTDDPSYLERKEKIAELLPAIWKEARNRGWEEHMQVEVGAEHSLVSYNPLPCSYLKKGRFAIDPKGNLYLCPTSAGYEKHKVGFVASGGSYRLNQNYYDIITRDPTQIPECADCIFLPICSAGCPIVACEAKGSYTAAHCGFSKRLKTLGLTAHLRSIYASKRQKNRGV